jgi:2-hydroxychromene-2-carboxylate isomerase
MREIMTTVDFYFDVMCPWAYQASKWIRAVHAERDIEVTWRFFSLEEFNRNEGKKHPWERPWSYGWSLLRIAALLRRGADGNDAVGQFYAVAGSAGRRGKA